MAMFRFLQNSHKTVGYTKPLFLCETTKSWTIKCKAELVMHAWLLLFQIKFFSRTKNGRQLGTTQVTSFMQEADIN